MKEYYNTKLGKMILGDSVKYMKSLPAKSVNLIVTSPPYALLAKKEYGNADQSEYVNWFKPFAKQFKRVLKDNGSLVVNVGGSWEKGQPTRNLAHFELLIMLCKEMKFHLAQEFFWWNVTKMPNPTVWALRRRVRVKDAVECVYWLSPTPWPKADNMRVLQPYSEGQANTIKFGTMTRPVTPSGHIHSENFGKDNGGSIPPNLLICAHATDALSYIKYCRYHNITPHPARFPKQLPEFFIRMLTDPGDLVIDPFGGSCTTGEVAERLKRKWACIDLDESYLKGAIGRFAQKPAYGDESKSEQYYKIPVTGALWNGDAPLENLPEDGGRTQRKRKVIVEEENMIQLQRWGTLV